MIVVQASKDCSITFRMIENGRSPYIFTFYRNIVIAVQIEIHHYNSSLFSWWCSYFVIARWRANHVCSRVPRWIYSTSQRRAVCVTESKMLWWKHRQEKREKRWQKRKIFLVSFVSSYHVAAHWSSLSWIFSTSILGIVVNTTKN